MKFMFISIRKNVVPIILIIFTLSLIIFSKTNIVAAKNGLDLWVKSVVPVLFPFFVATNLLSQTEIVSFLGRKLNFIMRPIFNVPGECVFALLMGMISGYPVGAKIVADFRKNNICTKDEGERMLAFTNNSGPLFIIGTVGVTLFGDSKTGILLLCTHILSCLSVGFLFGLFSPRNVSSSLNYKKSSSTKLNLGASIEQAISTILLIGGFVVLFSVILSILKQSYILNILGKLLFPVLQFFKINNNFSVPILSGIIELTNGVSLVSSVVVKNISTNIIICAFLLGFGGISVLLQVFSIISKTDLSIKKYVFGKLLQGFLAALYTFIALKFLPFLSLDITPVCSPIAEAIVYPISFFGVSPYFILILVLVFIVFFAFSKKNQKQNKGRLF